MYTVYINKTDQCEGKCGLGEGFITSYDNKSMTIQVRLTTKV